MQALAGAPRPELMATAVALAEEIGRPRLGGGPRAWLAKQTLWAGDLPAARELLEAVLADDARAGNELERPYRLYDLALLECAAGNFAAGDEIVRQGIEAARDAENADAEGWLLYPSALVAAWLGRADEARSTAEELLRWAGRRGGLSWIVRSKSVLGLLALSEGDAERAARELLEGAELLEEMGFAQPGALPIVPDAVEALAQTAEISSARHLLARLERQAEALDNDWVRATLERCFGLLLTQEDADSAVDPLGRAAAAFDRLGHRPDAARALLARGQALMRGSHRTLASDVLAEARTRFAALGASLWEARAIEELERVAPGRPAGDLTEAERRVAALVAQGLKNREIGQALFMSLATVEAHLTRIYRKLGVRSRSELTRLVAEGAVPLSAADEP
jgi:ATP/maltotriose-dependent transcriptional regulator MalT